MVGLRADQASSPNSTAATEIIDLGGGVTMEFVLIQPGTFTMGSAGQEPDEGPPRQITLRSPYHIGKYEITQAQWMRVIGSNPSHFRGDDRPVENVSWADCQEFLEKLSRLTGRRFALPTEAQWEYACRAGTTTEYSFGDAPAVLAQHAWHAANSQLATQPVGRMKPNAWGLHDMHGNVYEWCADWYSEGPYPQGDATDPLGPRSGRRRVLRGGAWLYVPDNLRSADRGFSPPEYRSNEYGLRCVMLAAGDSREDTSAAVVPAALRAEMASDADLAPTLAIALRPGVTMEFVLIRSGSFAMGSDASALDNEKPARQVTLTRPFYLGRYEVTQRQWEALMERNMSAFRDEGPVANLGSLPVENVSWSLCQTFLARLNEQVPERTFRLPTEAEWEYAARAGASDTRPFAEAELGEYAWHGANSQARTHAVGSKLPNAWGLYDMYGNVWEWCEDRYGLYTGQSTVDPRGPDVSQFAGARVLRGGAWNSRASHITATFRHEASPGVPMRYYGFRCVASVELVKAEMTR